MTNGPVAAEADALWRKQLGPLLTVTATASELSIPADDVEQMIEAKELLALPAEDGVPPARVPVLRRQAAAGSVRVRAAVR